MGKGEGQELCLIKILTVSSDVKHHVYLHIYNNFDLCLSIYVCLIYI